MNLRCLSLLQVDVQLHFRRNIRDRVPPELKCVERATLLVVIVVERVPVEHALAIIHVQVGQSILRRQGEGSSVTCPRLFQL